MTGREIRATKARHRRARSPWMRALNRDRMRAYREWQRGQGPHPRERPELYGPLYRLLYPGAA